MTKLKLKKIYEDKNITSCELYLPHNCWRYSGLSFAHKRKRRYYLGRKDLWTFNETILTCPLAHHLLEYGDKEHTGRELTGIVFKKLRGA